MAVLSRVTGMGKVLSNLKRFNGNFGTAFERGLKKAGLFLQRESQKIVPVDTSALKNSAFTRAEGKGFKTDVTVGYTQEYAVFVHENMDARHKPGKQAKFLEQPMNDKKDEMLGIIKDEAEKP